MLQIDREHSLWRKYVTMQIKGDVLCWKCVTKCISVDCTSLWPLFFEEKQQKEKHVGPKALKPYDHISLCNNLTLVFDEENSPPTHFLPVFLCLLFNQCMNLHTQVSSLISEPVFLSLPLSFSFSLPPSPVVMHADSPVRDLGRLVWQEGSVVVGWGAFTGISMLSTRFSLLHSYDLCAVHKGNWATHHHRVITGAHYSADE